MIQIRSFGLIHAAVIPCDSTKKEAVALLVAQNRGMVAWELLSLFKFWCLLSFTCRDDALLRGSAPQTQCLQPGVPTSPGS